MAAPSSGEVDAAASSRAERREPVGEERREKDGKEEKEEEEEEERRLSPVRVRPCVRVSVSVRARPYAVFSTQRTVSRAMTISSFVGTI
jgi:hypothetical protein